MRETGIIRRIDDLGRVAVPKEIRRNLHIHEGDALEIFLQDEMVCYKRRPGEVNLNMLLSDINSALDDSNFELEKIQKIRRQIMILRDVINE